MQTPEDFGKRATTLAAEEKFEEAEVTLRAGLARFPGQPILGYALAVLLLARERYAEGWPLYEFRRVMPGGPRQPSLSFPEWTGQAVRRLVVLPEQGLGDQIMYARWLPLLKRRGIEVTIVCEAPLAALFTRLGVDVLPISGQVQLPKADAWCFLGSLPRLTGEQPDDPYLPSPPTGGQGIGLMLRGGPRATDRSPPADLIPRLAALGTSLHPDDTGARTFAATAELIAKLDLVISIDTSVVHVAGAMGKPTWLLLPSPCDWRWGRTGETTHWYPSVRLFRQPSRGDWTSVVDAVLAAADAR